MAGLPIYEPPVTPPALLRCIIYCEFDPHKGPRPVFQVPPNYVSNETDPVSYTPFVKQIAQDFKALEMEHRYLTNPDTRNLIENILQGVLQDVNGSFRLEMPPSGFPHALPVCASKSQKIPNLPEYLATSSPNEIRPHEVPVLFIDNNSPVEEESAVFALIDGHHNVKDIAALTNLDIESVVQQLRTLLGRGLIRLVDRIKPWNKYIPTTKLSELLSMRGMQLKCVEYCALDASKPPPDFTQAYRLLCSLNQDQTLAEVCKEFGIAMQDAGTNMDVIKLIRFARASRFLRRLDHFPIWTNHAHYLGARTQTPDSKKPEPSKTQSNVLLMCDGDHSFDEIALTLGITEEEVETECCRGPCKDEVLVVQRMSAAGSTDDNP